jgi:hypothetical protein
MKNHGNTITGIVFPNYMRKSCLNFLYFCHNTSGHTSNSVIIFTPFPHNSDVAKLLPPQHSVKLFLLFHCAFQFAIYNGPTNALVCNKTLIQMSHFKILKITPTCFDLQMIIIRELFDPG